MKKTKQALSVLLSVVLLVLTVSTCFICFAGDASGGCGSGLTWTYNDTTKTLTISGNGAMNDYSGMNDVSTYTPWDAYSSKVLRVVIGNGVTRIGNNAFHYFRAITKVECPESVEAIGDCAFADCSSLVTVKFGSKVKSIGSQAFYECVALNTFTLPDSVERIGDYAFYHCPITDLTLSKNLETIGSYAFSVCNLVNVTMYNKVDVIGQEAFSYQNEQDNYVISHLYYYGSQADWNGIAIGRGNEPLTGAQRHYLGAPSDPGTDPTPSDPQQPEQDLNIFQRIIQWILDFFARLFGLNR